ncbi:hypothetical protein GCM10010423_65070 [Streptomyces levis]|uniref:Uncharacterized protein n=1 Tax=Streptomyces levis TaxID=285566 RepID=A0ABP6BFI6_9ACTN
MAEETQDINVDANRVIEVLKASLTARIAELEHRNAIMEVALQDAINERNQAEAENTELRKGRNAGVAASPQEANE